jgi:hypothetical protein
MPRRKNTDAENSVEQAHAPVPEDARALSVEQQQSLARLKELLERQFAPDTPSAPAWQQKALAKAVYSGYLDCLDMGVGREAHALLEQYGAVGDPHRAERSN